MKVEKKLKMLKETARSLSNEVDDFNLILEALIEEVEEKNKKDFSMEEANNVINDINKKENEVTDSSTKGLIDIILEGIDEFLEKIIEDIESQHEEDAFPCCKEEVEKKEAVTFCLKEGDLYTFYPYKSTFTLSRAEIIELLSFEDEEAEFIL